VLLSVGTGSKQIDLSSGKVLLQPTQTGVTIPTVTNLTNLPTMPTDWITADGVKADAVTKIQSGLATSEELAEAVADIQGTQGDTLQTITYKINTIDAVVDTIYAEMGSAPEIADAVLDELLDDHTIDGSLGDTVADIAAKTNNLPDNPALDEVLIDTGTQQFTTADLIKIIAAKMVGKASGGGTTSIVYRNLEDSVDIIVETVDENGNRSDITLAP
jgi:hypothetical protein